MKNNNIMVNIYSKGENLCNCMCSSILTFDIIGLRENKKYEFSFNKSLLSRLRGDYSTCKVVFNTETSFEFKEKFHGG